MFGAIKVLFLWEGPLQDPYKVYQSYVSFVNTYFSIFNTGIQFGSDSK